MPWNSDTSRCTYCSRVTHQWLDNHGRWVTMIPNYCVVVSIHLQHLFWLYFRIHTCRIHTIIELPFMAMCILLVPVSLNVVHPNGLH